MAPPEARIRFLPGQEGTMRAAIAAIPGGEVISIKEDKPLKVSEISPARFNRFVQEMEPSLLVPKLSFQSAFSTLRPLPEERQRQIITSFLVDRVEGFPNAEEYARFLAELNSTPWFSLREEPDQARVQELVDQYKDRQDYKPVKTTIVRDFKTAFEHRRSQIGNFPSRNRSVEKQWDEKTAEERAVDYKVYRLTNDASLSNIREALIDFIKKADINLNGYPLGQYAGSIAEYFVGPILLSAARWVVDNPNKENPYLPLINIFKLGGWPLGENAEGEFLVYFPKQSRAQLL